MICVLFVNSDYILFVSKMTKAPCAVPTCSNRKMPNSEIKFYCFPRDRNRQKLWVYMIGRTDINVERNISNIYFICEIHFHPFMIENGRLNNYALPILLTSPDSFILTGDSVHTQTDESKFNDKCVQTDDAVLLEVKNTAEKREVKSQTSPDLTCATPRKQRLRYKLRVAYKSLKKIEKKIKFVTASKNI